MSTTTVSVETFEAEVKRRLIDTFSLGVLLGLRTRQAVWHRVQRGTLPPPLLRIGNVSLWDRDAIEIPDGKEK